MDDVSAWLVSKHASDTVIRRYGDTLRVMATSLNRIRKQATAEELRDEAGVLSVCLRKLLFDGSGFIQRAIERPMFHRLAEVKQSRKNPSVVMRIHGRDHDGGDHNSYYEWYSLPGCSYAPPGLSRWSFYSNIFRENEPAKMRLSQWINQGLVAIHSFYGMPDNEGKELSLRQIMKFIVNNEGAHIDISGNPKEMDAEFLCLIGDSEGFTYLHWIVICIAIYIYNRQLSSMALRPDFWQSYVDRGIIAHLGDRIDMIPAPTPVNLRWPLNANEMVRIVAPVLELGGVGNSLWMHPDEVYRRYDLHGRI